MANQPILGSLAWMNQSMKTVNPVGDNRRLEPVLTSDDGLWILTDDDADVTFDDKRPTAGAFDSDYSILVDDNAVIIGNLVRWI